MPGSSYFSYRERKEECGGMLHAENGKQSRVRRSHDQQQCSHSNRSMSPQGILWAPREKVTKERGTGSLEKLDLVPGVFPV